MMAPPLKRWWAVAALSMTVVAAGAEASRAEPPPTGQVVVAAPGGFTPAGTYLTPVVVVQAGGSLSSLTFVNPDVDLHDVTSTDKDASGSPLFHSATIEFGETAPVVGVDRLQAGNSYAFYCSLHAWMRGTLVVT